MNEARGGVRYISCYFCCRRRHGVECVISRRLSSVLNNSLLADAGRSLVYTLSLFNPRLKLSAWRSRGASAVRICIGT